jgi:FtsH-binding integral membrane protein
MNMQEKPSQEKSSQEKTSPEKYSSRHTVSAGLAANLVFTLPGWRHSPSFNVLGSYFPGWIACMVASIIVTALVRFVLNRLQWEQRVPALPLFYFAMALLIACLIWLIAFE